MLVLARRRNEEIRIGDNIIIRVCDVYSSGVVRLGITAPRDVTIHRQEVYRRIEREGLRDEHEG